MKLFKVSSGKLYHSGDRWHYIGKTEMKGDTKNFIKNVGYSDVLNKEEKSEIIQIVKIISESEEVPKEEMRQTLTQSQLDALL